MTHPELIFTAASGVAAMTWLSLVASLFAAKFRPWIWLATGIVIPASFAIAYIMLLASGWGASPGGGFGSIGEVRTLFANDAALTAGWLHYLAFDLFVGTWIAREGLDKGVMRILLIPCLLLTFIFGPEGRLMC